MAKIKIRDVFVKLGYLFPQDLYIINGVYVTGGDESESNTNTYNICDLEPEVTEIIKESFPEDFNGNLIIYIPSIKNIKDAISGNYKVIDSKNEKEKILGKFNSLHDICLDVETWSPITDYLSDESIQMMYEKGLEVPIKINDDMVNVSKKLFPIVNDKTIKDIHVGISEEFSTDEYRRMVLVYSFSMFQMYLIITFLPV